jgi:5'-3' exonuclease
MKIAILDGNNIAFGIYSTFKESPRGLLRNSFGVPTTVIFGLLRTFSVLAEKTSFDRIVICWDVTGSKYRKKIFPLYKSHRKYVDMKDYFDELDSARLYIEKFGFNQLIAPGIEADDVIGYFSSFLVEKGNEVIIISDDKDFFQLVRKGIKIYRPIKDMFVTRRFVVDEFGVSPKVLIKAKAITGEDTDFIPGVCDINVEEKKLIKCRLGIANALKILNGKKTLVEAIDTCSIDKWKNKLKEKREQILVSYKLARIRNKEKFYEDWELNLLKSLEPKALEERQVKIKEIVKLSNDLEIKAFSVPLVLRKIGIKMDKKPNIGEIKT